jgi:hypothetical protein
VIAPQVAEHEFSRKGVSRVVMIGDATTMPEEKWRTGGSETQSCKPQQAQLFCSSTIRLLCAGDEKFLLRRDPGLPATHQSPRVVAPRIGIRAAISQHGSHGLSIVSIDT